MALKVRSSAKRKRILGLSGVKDSEVVHENAAKNNSSRVIRIGIFSKRDEFVLGGNLHFMD